MVGITNQLIRKPRPLPGRTWAIEKPRPRTARHSWPNPANASLPSSDSPPKRVPAARRRQAQSGPAAVLAQKARTGARIRGEGLFVLAVRVPGDSGTTTWECFLGH